MVISERGFVAFIIYNLNI